MPPVEESLLLPLLDTLPGVVGTSADKPLKPAPGLAARLFELFVAINGGGIGLGALLFLLLAPLALGVLGPKFNRSDALELFLDRLGRIEESLLLEATVVQNKVDIGSI